MLTLSLGTALVLVALQQSPSEQPRIDASTNAAIEASLKRMCDSLNGECKPFMLALDTLTYPEWVARGKKPDLVPLYKSLDGLTAQQVIARAHALEMKRMEEMRQRASWVSPVGPRAERYPQRAPAPAKPSK